MNRRMTPTIVRAVWLLSLLAWPMVSQAGGAPGQPTTHPATQPSVRLALAPAAAPDRRPTVEMLSVQITRPMSPDLTRAVLGARRAAGWNGGGTPGSVDLVFAVRIPGRMILQVFPETANEDPFRIAAFTDDRDINLAPTAKQPRRTSGTGYASTTADGTAIVVALSSARPPAEGASQVTLRGSLTVRTSTGDKTSERQNLPLDWGKAVDVGGIPLGVRTVIKGNSGVRLTLSAKGSLERVKSVRFFSPGGEEIKAKLSGRAENRAPHHSMIAYELPPGLDEVEVEATYMDAIETLTVPVEVSADIGAARAGAATARPPDK